MNPTKTIRISNGTINYTFTVYQQTEERLPGADKLEDIMLAVFEELRRHYHEVNFHVEYFHENLSRQWRLFFQIRNTQYSTQRIAVSTWINHIQYLKIRAFELSAYVVTDVRRKMHAFIGAQRWRISPQDSVIIIGNNERTISFTADSFKCERECIEHSLMGYAMDNRVLRNVSAEITARFHMSECEINDAVGHFSLKGLDLEIKRASYRYTGGFVIEVALSPNINCHSVALDTEGIIFETRPHERPFIETVVYERVGIETSAFVGNSIMGTATERTLRRRESEAIIRQATNDNSCKYFNGGTYLRCAVNPAGTCDGCKDYEPK